MKNCVYWQWFSKVFLSLLGNILYRMMLVFNAVPPEGSKVIRSNVGFWPCCLCAEISPDCLNLLMILWTVHDKILTILHWETFLNCNAICSSSYSQSGKPWPILACEQLNLSGMLLLYSIMTLTCFQLTCSPMKCPKEVFFEHSSTFPVFCCCCPSFFGTCCIKFKISEYLQKKTIKFISLNIEYLVFVV